MASVLNVATAARPPVEQVAAALPDLDRIKRNVAKMVELQAPEEEIENYVSQEGVTRLDVKAHKRNLGIDYAGHPQAVRDAIGQLPDPEDQELAQKQWAQSRVSADRKEPSILRQYVGEPLRNVARGVGVGPVNIGEWSDEIDAGVSGLANTLTGGAVGTPYEEGVAYNREYDRQVDDDLGLTGTALKFAGGVASGAPVVQAARTGAGRVATSVAVGGGQANTGYAGSGEGSITEREQGATLPTVVGAGLGLAAGGGAELYRAGRMLNARGGLSGERHAQTELIEGLPGKSVDKLADDLSSGAYRSNPKGYANQRRAFDIVGEEMLKANGNRQAGMNAAINRISAELNVQPPQAAQIIKNIEKGHGGSELYMLEYQSVANANKATRGQNNPDFNRMNAAEETGFGGNAEYVGTSKGTRGQERFATAAGERAGRARDVLRGWISKAAKGRDLDDAEQQIAGVNSQAKRAYDDVYNAPGGTKVNYQMLHGLLPRVLDRHINKAANRAGNPRAALDEAIGKFYVDVGGGRKIAMPSLRQLQDMRTSLRKQIKDLRGTALQPGDTEAAQALQPLYNDITRIMRKSSPDWGKANDLYRDGSVLDDALEFGEDLVKNPGRAQRTSLREFDRMAPEVQELYRIGYLQQLDNELQRLGDSHDVAKLFTNERSRNVISRLFPKEDAAGFVRAVRDLRVANATRQRSLGNSATFGRIELHNIKDADLNTAAAVSQGNVGQARNWIVQTVKNRLKALKVGRMEPYLTTQARDIPAAAMRTQQLRIQQQRLAKARRARTQRPQRLTAGIEDSREGNE